MIKTRVDFTIVDFTGNSDGVKALYHEDTRIFYGDYYHDDIDVKIRSFIEGVEWTGAIISETKLTCTDQNMIESISEQGNVPPNSLKDVDMFFYEKQV